MHHNPIMEQDSTEQHPEIFLSVSDIRQAAAEGVIAELDSQNLIKWACEKDVQERHYRIATAPPELNKGFNIVTVVYYFGAMLMISACAWFLGDKWEVLGSRGLLVTTIIYFAIAFSAAGELFNTLARRNRRSTDK